MKKGNLILVVIIFFLAIVFSLVLVFAITKNKDSSNFDVSNTNVEKDLYDNSVLENESTPLPDDYVEPELDPNYIPDM